MNQTLSGIVTILTAIIGVAILAVLVSRQSNTTGVIKAASSGFAEALQAAVSPITGGYSNTYGFQPSF
jgi:hypothetical protein